MKRIVCCLLLMVVVLLQITGCACKAEQQEPPEYQYIDGEGNDFVVLNMTFREDYPYPGPDGLIKFASVEEMINDLKTGSLTLNGLWQLKWMDKDEEGRIIIPDLDTLYQPTHPECETLKSIILWPGGTYSYKYEELSVSFMLEEEFKWSLDAHPYEQAPIVTMEDVDEKKMYDGTAGNFNIYIYRYQMGEWMVYIQEWYDVRNEGETLLSNVGILIDNGEGVYLKITRIEFPEDYSTLQWLESFDIRPYEQ